MKIGLEVHVALSTKTKLFCSDSVKETEEPNSQICPICVGLPGSRPVLNKEAVRVAKSISLALRCKIKEKISFIRKVYFYPDLPKSFQITQLSESIGSDGILELENKKIRIRRVQIEEDPAKVIREDGYSSIDFNRSGVPLVEIVTEPDITSEDELRETIFTLRALLYYQNIDINQEIKTDLNISLGKERIEIKNVTGIKNLIEAAQYEIKRQGEIVAKGNEPEKETRSFDEASNTTKSSRKKESEEEYGFIYEPDLTEYSTNSLKVDSAIVPTNSAKEISKEHNFSYKTILELIAFDRGSLNLIKEFDKEYDFQTIVAALEVIKRFDEKRDKKTFKEVLELTSQRIDITKDIIDKINSGTKINIKSFSNEEIDSAIKEMVLSDPEILKRYSKNKKVVNFIVGTIAKKYGIQPREVSARMELIIAKLLNNN